MHCRLYFIKPGLVRVVYHSPLQSRAVQRAASFTYNIIIIIVHKRPTAGYRPLHGSWFFQTGFKLQYLWHADDLMMAIVFISSQSSRRKVKCDAAIKNPTSHHLKTGVYDVTVTGSSFRRRTWMVGRSVWADFSNQHKIIHYCELFFTTKWIVLLWQYTKPHQHLLVRSLFTQTLTLHTANKYNNDKIYYIL